MKKHLIQTLLLSSLLVVSVSLFVRPVNSDSAESYNYWSKRGVIEMVYAYMQDYLIIADTNKVVNEFKGAENYRMQYIVRIDSVDIENIDFQSISNFLLANNWKDVEGTLLKDLINKIDKKSPLDDNFFVINTNYNNNQYWNKKKDFILFKYKKELEKKEVLAKTSSLWGVVSKLFYFLFGLITGASSLYLISKSKIYSILYGEIDHYESKLDKSWRYKFFFKYIALISVLKERKDIKNKLIKEQEDELIKLRFNLENSKMNYGNSENIEDNLIQKEDKQEYSEEIYAGKEIELNVEPVNPNANSNIYFTIPENDGSFKISNARNYKAIDCFYRIEVDSNSQKGKLYYIPSEFDSRALDNIDNYLNPVCDIESISQRINARNIILIKPGIVYINDDCWKIDTNKKVKIRFN